MIYNKNISNKQFKIATIISTYFGFGFAKFCPGTVGSLMTFPLFLLINILLTKLNIFSFYELVLSYSLIFFIIFKFGLWSINIYITKNNKKDPSEVVIDEVAGQFIAYVIPTVLTTYFFNFVLNDFIYNSILLNLTSILMITCPFIFFRLFDISKPGLVGYFDTKVEGAIGIMMDDVVAGIYSGLISSLILISFFIVMILC